MPRGDGTGPVRMGPMTDRAAGYCAGYGMPGYYAPQPYGYGPAYPQADPQLERQFLENEAKVLQEELEEIKKRLANEG